MSTQESDPAAQGTAPDEHQLQHGVPSVMPRTFNLNLCDPAAILSPEELGALHDDLQALADKRRHAAARAASIIVD